MRIFEMYGRIIHSIPTLTVTVLVAVGLAGCGDLLDIEDSENLDRDGIGDASPEVLVARAYSDLQVAYSGGGLDDKVLSVSALMSDEFFSSGTFATRTATDQRSQFPSASGNTSDPAYGELHDVRIAARDAITKLTDEVGPADPRIPVMHAFAGYAVVALSENYCSSVPLSTPTADFRPGEDGEPLTTDALFERAVASFDAALQVAAPGTPGAHLASVGKGRALLNLGRFQEAANAVSAVPTDFIWFIEHSDNTTDQENPIWNLQGNGRYSLSDGEGGGLGVQGNGLAFRHKDGDPGASAADPRVPWVEDPAGGFDGATPLFVSLRYPSRNANVVLADGIEARLIEAEAAIRGGDTPGAETILNDLRADVTALMQARYDDPTTHAVASSTGTVNGLGETLDPLTLPVDPGAATDVLFRERAFWLFNTGHRLGDLRRLARAPYDRSPSDLYPSGGYHKGGQYGGDVNFWIAFQEVNNSKFSIDMCSVTSP